MSTVLDAFRYHLQTQGSGYYPEGFPCLFLAGERWEHLCHNIANTKANKKVISGIYGRADLIDLPVINVLPGSREANMGFRHGYSRIPYILPAQVISAAQMAIRETMQDTNRWYVNQFLKEDVRDIGIQKVMAYRVAFEKDVTLAYHPHKKFEE